MLMPKTLMFTKCVSTSEWFSNGQIHLLNQFIKVATMQLEDTMFELKKNYTIIIVTHNMQQAARASDYTAFFYLGDLIEYDKTNNIFQNAKLQSTSDYVSGHFG